MSNPIRPLLLILMTAISAGTVVAQQNQTPSAPPQSLSPKQQITGFYATCKNGTGGNGLREMLSANPIVKAEDVNRVAAAFEQLLGQMGGFLDFDFLHENQISERVVVIRCAAHFERQPFVNEFTFYDPGKGNWRLIHLRYDANPASMFSENNQQSEAGAGR